MSQIPPITPRMQWVDPKTGLVTMQAINFWQQLMTAINSAGNTASSAIADVVAGTGLSADSSGNTVTLSNSGVLAFNGRAGAVTLAGADVTAALGYSPAHAGEDTVTSSPSGQLAWYSATGTTIVGNPNVTYSGGELTLGVAGATAGSLVLSGGTSGSVTVKTQAAAGSWAMTLPATAGAASQVLTTDGTGALSWSTPSAGGGSNWKNVSFNSAPVTINGASYFQSTSSYALPSIGALVIQALCNSPSSATSTTILIQAVGSVGYYRFSFQGDGNIVGYASATGTGTETAFVALTTTGSYGKQAYIAGLMLLKAFCLINGESNNTIWASGNNTNTTFVQNATVNLSEVAVNIFVSTLAFSDIESVVLTTSLPI